MQVLESFVHVAVRLNMDCFMKKMAHGIHEFVLQRRARGIAPGQLDPHRCAKACCAGYLLCAKACRAVSLRCAGLLCARLLCA